MKRHKSLHVFMAVALAMLLLLPVAAAFAEDAAPLLLTDITWDMTPEQIAEAEGAGGSDMSEAYNETGAQYAFNHPAEGDEPLRQVVYAFMGGQLLMYSCMADVAYQADGWDAQAYYDAVLANLSAVYGEPTQEQTQAIIMLTAMAASSAEDGSVQAYTLWAPDETTVIYLEYRDETTVSYTYVNGPALFGTMV